MLKCRDMAEQASEILDGRATWRERLPARVHLMMCLHCRRYFRQIKLTIKLIRRMRHADARVDATGVLQAIDRFSKR
jgi:predicted anti-sigma-YlaC factor YlaD